MSGNRRLTNPEDSNSAKSGQLGNDKQYGGRQSGNLQGLRSASDSGVAVLKTDRSEVTQGSASLDGPRFASLRGISSVPSVNQIASASASPTVPIIRTYSGRLRQSGLFSKDEHDEVLSRNGSIERYRANAEQAALGSFSLSEAGGDGERRHPNSIAGSSMGGSSDEIEMGRRMALTPFKRKWRRFRRKYKGCIFALLSSLTSSLASFFVHELTRADKYTPAYCLLWRYFGVLFPGIFIVLCYRYYQKEMVFDTVWPLHDKEPLRRFILSVARGVVDVLSVYLNYKAFEHLLQSETSTILNSKPIIVQLLAHYTLGEPWGIVPIVMSVVAVIGVVVVSKPPFLVVGVTNSTKGYSGGNFVEDRLPGVLYSTGSMLLASIVYCILRYLKDVHYSIFSLYIGTVGVLFGVGMTLAMHEFTIPMITEDWAYFVVVAALVCCSSISIVIALQNEEAFVVSLVRSCDVIFSFLWEMCIKQKFPDWYRGGGAVIIMFCVVVIFFRKYLTHQPPDSKVYRRFSFLTK